MKHIITLVALLMLTQFSFAQNYNDLQILFADGNYEKLVKEAEKYNDDDDTKYDPAPYIWAAKGLYEISLSGTDDEKFDNAFKDGITFLSKGIKYDLKKNDGQEMEEHAEFIEKYQMACYQRISNELLINSYKKAYSWCVKYKKISQEPTGINFVIGACKYNDGDRSSSRTAWQEANESLQAITGIEDWSEADKNMLKLGVIKTAQTYKETMQMDLAKSTLNSVAHWFEDDEEFQAQYDEIVNG